MGPGLDSLLHHHTRPTLHPTTPQLVTDRTKITIRTSLSFSSNTEIQKLKCTYSPPFVQDGKYLNKTVRNIGEITGKNVLRVVRDLPVL